MATVKGAASELLSRKRIAVTDLELESVSDGTLHGPVTTARAAVDLH
jgi:hypothetical protein